MAYTHPTLHRVGPANSDAPTLWTYSTTDTAATCDTAGYFNDAADDLTVGDFIFGIFDTGGTATHGILVVNANDGTTVDTANIDALGAADTD